MPVHPLTCSRRPAEHHATGRRRRERGGVHDIRDQCHGDCRAADESSRVAGVDDLANPAVKVALCQPQVPCGAVAAEVFANAEITITPVTLEPDVRAVLSKVQLGEVDAGVVYLTDVLAAGDQVDGVKILPT